MIEMLPDFAAHSRLSSSLALLAQNPRLETAIVEAAQYTRSASSTVLDSRARNDVPGETEAQLPAGSFGTSQFLHLYQTTETRVMRLNECFGPVSRRDPTAYPPLELANLPPFPSVADVSLAFQLNFWQHAAFETMARHVLYCYRQDIEREAGSTFDRPPHSDLQSQLVRFLGGEAGTGKSTVIHALLKFANLWGRDGSMETLAFTGVAAINVAGRTIHSARNLSTHKLDAPSPSSEMKNNFSKVVLTIIDEISMTDRALLGRADAVTRQMSPNHDRVWGGRHLCYRGDWFQKPPVGGIPAFKQQDRDARPFTAQGYSAYSAINFVVFLTDNMRARYDNL